MDGRVALVTGGSSGIGRASALALAGQGATVVVASTREQPREGGVPTIEAVESAGGKAVFVRCDVTDGSDRAAAVAVAEDLGGLDVLVNNAGVFGVQDFLAVTEDEYDRVADVNLKSAFFMAQLAARVMVPRGRGSIVNLSSMGGLQGSGGFAAYCATKFGIRGLTYALADELGPSGVRVNAIHPGVIATSMTQVDLPVLGTEAGESYLQTIPLRRAGTSDEVAQAVVYLASDLSSYVNGSSLTVDGGYIRS